jgi:cohesin domain-containing protein
LRRGGNYTKPNAVFSVSNKGLFIGIAMFLVLLSSVPYSAGFGAASTVHSAATSVNPSPQVSGSPTVIVTPTSLLSLPLGSTFSVQVQVQNMPQFNGWDIQVVADPNIINATSLSIAGNDFAVNASAGTPVELIHCLNGAGSGCKTTDHKGIVHSAYGNSGLVSGNGLLFTITYVVTGSNSNYYTGILLQNDGITSGSGSGSGILHVSVSGVYNNPNPVVFGVGGTGHSFEE